jgi:predicted GNAT superfamily acetyltransferase
VSDIHPIAAADEPAVLEFNNEHAADLSLLDAARLSQLLGQSFHARRVGAIDAFMIAFDETAEYDSPNFLWFRQRYPRFAYVDRIAVAETARGRGLGRKLYEELFAAARTQGHTVAVCEVNVVPPNPRSDAFHTALGFKEVGLNSVYGGSRTVRYYARRL